MGERWKQVDKARAFPVSQHRAAKHIQRAIRAIPVEQIAPVMAAGERDGMWCLVDGDLSFVPADGGQCITQWDDPVQHALYVRYVLAHPERVHDTHEAAVAFVRSQMPERGN
jgi:hypothetical protein